MKARKNKALGAIDQIMQILETVFFGKFHFEVAMVLRSSLFLSSLLLNSEAWVNLSEQDIRSLEQSDEILISKILGSTANTSNAFKYLELGIFPLRFEIMKRKLSFLQYLLKQEKTSMIFQVFQATSDNLIILLRMILSKLARNIWMNWTSTFHLNKSKLCLNGKWRNC